MGPNATPFPDNNIGRFEHARAWKFEPDQRNSGKPDYGAMDVRNTAGLVSDNIICSLCDSMIVPRPVA